MSNTYGRWHSGIKPSKWEPDYGMSTRVEIERWERDLEREKEGNKEYEGYYGMGVYED